MERKNEYALIVKICEIMNKKNHILSKISLQQLIFILKESYDINLRYEFELFTYGPYSVTLIEDLDYLFTEEIVNIEYCQGPLYFGSKIILRDEWKQRYQISEDFVQKNEDKIEKVIELFGRYNARELELRGALIYLKKYDLVDDKEKIIRRIQVIKPYFKEEEIRKAIVELNNMNLY